MQKKKIIVKLTILYLNLHLIIFFLTTLKQATYCRTAIYYYFHSVKNGKKNRSTSTSILNSEQILVVFFT